jgi:type VI secretion system protein ImpE
LKRESVIVANEVSAGGLFREGRLKDAIAAATARVRAQPGAAGMRVLLAELLLFAGNLERADTQVDTAATLDPTLAIAVAEFRQLLRAEQARGQLLSAGRVPEFLEDGPTAAQQAALACVVAIRAGDLTAAAMRAAEAEAVRAAVAFLVDGRLVDDFRDADDVVGGSLEVLTPTGKYMWIPFERVLALTLHAPERARDLYWRRATLEVANGPHGEVYVPAVYGCDAAESDEALRLGRATDWRDLAEGLTRGIGQRVFMAGEDGVPVMELASLVRA